MLKKFKHFWKKTTEAIAPYLIAYLGMGILRLILKTCTIKIEGSESFIGTASQNKCLLMLWHSRLALVPFILERCAPQFIYAAFISKSRDGDLLSMIASRYDAGRVIRVPHNTRHLALKEMIRHIENREIVLITPDGPRGPAGKIKPGVVLGAKEASAYIIPWSWEADKCWRLGTWDKLMLPKPFSTITASFGAPLMLGEEEMPEQIAKLQNAMNEL